MKVSTSAKVVDQYMKDASRYEVLSRGEETRLARRYRVNHDVAAGQAIVAANLRYAVKVAHKFVAYGCPLEDLVQEANVGMLRALRRFDERRGYRFISYATYWITAMLRNYVMVNVSHVKFGTTQRERSAFTAIARLFNQARAARPDAVLDDIYDEIASTLALNSDEAQVIHQRTRNQDRSLNERLPPSMRRGPGVTDGQETWLDVLADEDATPVDEEVGHQLRQREVLRIAYGCARDLRERYLLSQRLLADDPLTLAEIGSVFKISRERVRQVERALLRRVRAALVDGDSGPS